MDEAILEFQVLKSSLKQLIKRRNELNIDPSILLDSIFSIMDKELDTGEVKKILYCSCYGGFGYSKEFLEFMSNEGNDLKESYRDLENRELYNKIVDFANSFEPKLSITEALEKASSEYCELSIEDVPSHRSYHINEYDGSEYVAIENDFTSPYSKDEDDDEDEDEGNN